MSNENFNWRKSSRSNGSGACVEVASVSSAAMDRWRKSSRSNGSGECVEVADTAGVIMVRDTTNRDGGTLSFAASAWERFITSL